jgi:thiamine-monophosphate kinase
VTGPSPGKVRAGKRSRLDEATVIRRYFTRPGPRRGDVVLDIGDDAAVTRLAPGYDLVTATDAIFEGVHFPRGTGPRPLGHRCLAVNLSDLAALGAMPLWTTLTLSMPAADGAWLREFSRGFFALADTFDVALIGGDTVRGPLGMSVTILGRVRPGGFVPRSGARPGDGVYVTGHPGDAVAGRLLLGSRRNRRGSGRLRRRFLYPSPRVREGAGLVGIASAMMDISDGLHDDARKLLQASGCGADLDAGAIPLSEELLRFAGSSTARELALTGGDDYELLFTVPATMEPRLRRLAGRWSCAVTRLGVVTARRGLRWHLAGKPYAFADQTFRHFA